MATFTQAFLKPGRYGSAGEWSKERIAAHVKNTRALIAAGRNPPVLLEHAEPGSADGAPRDRKAAQVKHGAGWVIDVRQEPDGSAVYDLDVTDSEVARKLKEGSIRFTSPEFRREFIHDETGERFESVIAHAALTHRPRSINQGKISEALQFSLEDYEGPIQMADDADDKPGQSEKPKETPENPDLPKTGDDGKDKAKFEAIIEHLKNVGIGLPADTDQETFIDRLLTALLTKEASDAKAEAEKPKEDEDDGMGNIVEQQPPMQFSLSDAEAGKLDNKLLAKCIKQEHAALRGRLEGMVSAGKITPACRDSLLANDTAIQFSADGEHLVAYTLPQVVELLDKTTIAGMGLTAEQFSLSTTAKDHPKGEAFVRGDKDGQVPETPEQAEATARRIHSRHK